MHGIAEGTPHTKSEATSEESEFDSDGIGEGSPHTKSGATSEESEFDSDGSGELTSHTNGFFPVSIPVQLNVSYAKEAAEALTTILKKEDITFMTNVGKGHCLIFAFLQGEFELKCKD